jgi:hypothetical protein
MNDPDQSKTPEPSAESAPNSTDRWMLANALLVGFGVYPLIIAVSGAKALQEGPTEPHPLQIAAFIASGLVAFVYARFLARGRSELEGISKPPDFRQFLYCFVLIGGACLSNSIIGVVTGRGPQIWFGLGFCYFLFFVLLVPVYFKMRPVYKLTEA